MTPQAENTLSEREQPEENEQEANSGIVYVLTNEAMPGLVKIGRTTQDDPRTRIDQLYNTSVPVPFDCVLAVRVNEPKSVEEALHRAFGPQRINPKREFFTIDSGQATALLEVIGFEDVTPEVKEAANKSIPEVELSASETLRKRRPNMNFEEMQIPDGAELAAVKSDDVAVVSGPRKVRFREEEMSITQATKAALNIDYAVPPTAYWRYEGELLQDIYNRTYVLNE